MVARSILPVLDIREGRVVRAQGGNRAQYRCELDRKGRPRDVLDVARERCARAGSDSVYVADLTSLAGGDPPDWTLYAPLHRAGITGWVDGCWRRGSPLEWEARLPGWRPILSTEAHRDLRDLSDSAGRWRGQAPVFSLDLRDGQVVWGGEGSDSGPNEVVASAVAIGFSAALLLELSAVGSGSGPVGLARIRQLRARYPHLEIVSGGGVRDASDLRALWEAGCNRVLVATALAGSALGGGGAAGEDR